MNDERAYTVKPVDISNDNRVILVCNGEEVFLMDYDGSGIGILVEEWRVDVGDILDPEEFGIWIWEGSVDFKADSEGFLLRGDLRKLTKEEFSKIQ